MRSVPSGLLALLQNHALAEGTVHVLVEISDPVAPIRRVLDSDAAVSWDGETFYPDNGGFSILSSNLDGKRPAVTLTLQNVRSPEDDAERYWSAWLLANNPNGREVTFRVVSPAGDPSDVWAEALWYVSGVEELTVRHIAFHVGSPHDAAANEMPRHSLGGRSCAAKYKQGFCVSTSSLPDCPKTLAACARRYPDETLRFGPSYPLMTGTSRRAA